MNLKAEARFIAEEALDESNSFDHAQKLIYASCHKHKVALCEATAMQMCIDQDTRDALDYLDAYEGGVALPGDKLGDIVCRVAKHTLLFAALDYLGEPVKQKEPNG